MQALLGVSDAIDRVLERIARLFGWLFLALVAVICWDVLTRKLGFQIPGFGSSARRPSRSWNGIFTGLCSCSGWATPTSAIPMSASTFSPLI
jgi:hypothetical protein